MAEKKRPLICTAGRVRINGQTVRTEELTPEQRQRLAESLRLRLLEGAFPERIFQTPDRTEN